jgi:hypothetical protein
MEYTIKSRKFNRTVTFSRPGGHYIYVDWNDKPGTLGYQICDGGDLMGSTISYSGNSPSAFEAICKRWWRKFAAQTDAPSHGEWDESDQQAYDDWCAQEQAKFYAEVEATLAANGMN